MEEPRNNIHEQDQILAKRYQNRKVNILEVILNRENSTIQEEKVYLLSDKIIENIRIN